MLYNIDVEVNWLTQVRELLMSMGLAYISYNQSILNTDVFITQIKMRLSDMFIQDMEAYFELSKCSLYRYLPETHSLQFYLQKSMSEKKKI